MAHYDVAPMAAVFGAEVRGFDPATVPEGDAAAELRSLLDEHQLLLFRDVDALSYPVQTRLTALLVGHEDRLAEQIAASVPLEEKPPSYVSNREQGSQAPYGRLLFHTDMMWAEDPCHALSLYGVDVEQPSVPTVFASAARAWETLPPDLRSRVEGLSVLQLTGTKMREVDDDLLVSNFAQDYSTVTPIATPHPRTGRTLLFVSQGNTQEIVGMDEEASEALLEELFQHLYSPAHLLEHPWRAGDLVVWDNLAVQHARANVQADGPVRTLQKVFSPAVTPMTVDALAYSRLD
jgi:alpha-ketoglutarate-dependent taurine dioxygenase